MRGMHRNIALLLLLAATLVASSAEAKVGAGGSGAAGAAAQRMTRAAQVRLNRMKQKMSLRPRGAMIKKTRRQLRLGKRQMMRAMSRREVGLHGSEAERTRAAFARSTIGSHGGGTIHDTMMAPPKAAANQAADDNHEKIEKLAKKQRKKMRAAAKRRSIDAFKKMRRRD